MLKKRYDFHHVGARSISGNERYQLDIELGLVINKDTHKVITKEGIVDEDELYVFCMNNNWKIDWYDTLKEELKNINRYKSCYLFYTDNSFLIAREKADKINICFFY